MKFILKGGTILDLSLDEYNFVFNKDRLCAYKRDEWLSKKDSVEEYILPFSILERVEL